MGLVQRPLERETPSQSHIVVRMRLGMGPSSLSRMPRSKKANARTKTSLAALLGVSEASSAKVTMPRAKGLADNPLWFIPVQQRR